MNLARIKHLLAYARTLPRLGPRALLHNVHYRIGLKTGRYEKVLPESRWKMTEQSSFKGAPWRQVSPESLSAVVAESARLVSSADSVTEGAFIAFSWCPVTMSGNWQKNPQTGYEPPRVHWSRIPSLPGAVAGDIKWTWEGSRFEWVYVLGRAWSLQKNPQYPETFWRLLLEWRNDNPPQQGVNWMSGQESALKIFALLWAANLWIDEASQEQRLMLLETVALLAETIETVIGYALSQRNNHGLGEAVALHLAGSVLHGHRYSETWRQKGFQLAIGQITDQFASDGSYIQHSNNYARVALRYASIFLTTAAWTKQELPPSVRSLLLEAVRFLWIQQDQETGQLPNYGANDGANPLPLNSCDYRDFRPALHCVYWQLTGEKLYAPGPWDEELLWVYGQPDEGQLFNTERPVNHAADEGGYYVCRGPNSHAMIRCTSLKSRPGHADMLHFDFWANGKNLLSDGGTFQYIDANGWGSYLSSTAAHNTVEVNGNSQMTRGGHFLWLDWTRAKLLNYMTPERIGLTGWDGQYLAGEHFGYYHWWSRRGVIHRRQVLHAEGQWLIVDDLIAKRVTDYSARLHWHLDGVVDWEQLDVSTSQQRAHARSKSEAFDLSVWGLSGNTLWLDSEANYPVTLRSRFYGRGHSCTLLAITATASGSMRWVTALGQEQPVAAEDRLQWRDLTVSLHADGSILQDYGATRLQPLT